MTIYTSMHGIPFAPRAQVRVGFIGVGGRGRSLLGALLATGAQVAAVADMSPDAAAAAAEDARARGSQAPAIHSGSEGWRGVLDMDLDLVLISTPWDTHTPLALAAMAAGKHVAVEVPAALTLDECWQLVDASERTRRHCVMLENCCYDYWEMLVKRMVRAGLFGTLTHAECAYIHDLRSLLISDRGEGLWRRIPHTQRNGNLYTTHGLGPVAQCLGIGQDDAFDYMVSMSSREASLSGYRDGALPAGDAKRNERYVCGDMNTSLIRTKLGRTILLQHDVVTPRPYDRNFLIAGTQGLFRDYPPRLFLDGQHGSGDKHDWLPVAEYQAQWEDPLWTALGDKARGDGGHGGCDFMMLHRLIACMSDGLPPEMDVYDAAEWSAPGPLSEASVAQGSAPIAFPDFRRS